VRGCDAAVKRCPLRRYEDSGSWCSLTKRMFMREGDQALCLAPAGLALMHCHVVPAAAVPDVPCCSALRLLLLPLHPS
jgi:hypothetical protein